MSLWRITDASFKGQKFHVAIPDKASNFGMTSQSISKERRLQVSEKPGIDGADVEDFGQKPRIFSAEVIFFGDDYRDNLKAFEKILDQGTSGILILPDLDEAVWAKFQKEDRRTTAQDGTATMLSISWIEDRRTQVTAQDITAADAAKAALSSGNVAQSIPTISDKANSVVAFSNAATNTLQNNSVITAVLAVESAVVSTTTSINAVTNIGRNAIQQIITVYHRATAEIANLQASIRGLLTFTDNLNLGLTQKKPTRYNTGLGAEDFTQPPTSTTTVGPTNSVVVASNPSNAVNSFTDAINLLTASIANMKQNRLDLESSTKGSTNDFSLASIQLENQAKELLNIITPATTTNYVVLARLSLVEICFANGLTADQINNVYLNNTQITDPLVVPPMTVIAI